MSGRPVMREMAGDDFLWAAGLMAERRVRYAAYSPVFWRPASGVTQVHAEFMRAVAGGDGAVALRSDGGFVVAASQGDRLVVDDLAVDADARWAVDGRQLLLDVWRRARSAQVSTLRVVCALRDEPKRAMLRQLGMSVAERWWVRELEPTGEAEWGPVDLGVVDAMLVPAPPVYDPGGPVCLLGDLDPSRAVAASTRAAEHGAVLAIVQRSGRPPESEPELEDAGFHNPSEFYEGDPVQPI